METYYKNLSTVFQLKVIGLKTQYFYRKLPCERPMLRQTEWEVQNGPITKNGDLAATTYHLNVF